MKTRVGDAIRFKNGNINIRFSQETIDDIKSNRFSDIECLSYALEDVDCYFYGEQFCLSNYAMGIMIYNFYSDKVYLLNFADTDKLLQGKTLKLYARKPDEYDREQIHYCWKNSEKT